MCNIYRMYIRERSKRMSNVLRKRLGIRRCAWIFTLALA